MSNKHAQQTGAAGGFHTLNLKVMLGVSEALKARFVTDRDVLFEIFKHALVELGPLTRHAVFELFSGPHRTIGNRVKFHSVFTVAFRVFIFTPAQLP